MREGRLWWSIGRRAPQQRRVTAPLFWESGTCFFPLHRRRAFNCIPVARRQKLIRSQPGAINADKPPRSRASTPVPGEHRREDEIYSWILSLASFVTHGAPRARAPRPGEIIPRVYPRPRPARARLRGRVSVPDPASTRRRSRNELTAALSVASNSVNSPTWPYPPPPAVSMHSR